jgi:hypothetical protein
MVLPTVRTKLFHLDATRGRLLVLRARVVAIFAFNALKSNNLSWHLPDL